MRLRAFAFLAFTLGTSAGVGGAVAILSLPPAVVKAAAHPSPRRCLLAVAGPTKLYYCGDGHAWARAGREWKDAGALTPPPVVPQ